MIQYLVQWWSQLSTLAKWGVGALGWLLVAIVVGLVIGAIIRRHDHGAPEQGCTPEIFPEAGRTRAERLAWMLDRLPAEQQATVIDQTRPAVHVHATDANLEAFVRLLDASSLGRPETTYSGVTGKPSPPEDGTVAQVGGKTLIHRDGAWRSPKPLPEGDQ